MWCLLLSLPQISALYFIFLLPSSTLFSFPSRLLNHSKLCGSIPSRNQRLNYLIFSTFQVNFHPRWERIGLKRMMRKGLNVVQSSLVVSSCFAGLWYLMVVGKCFCSLCYIVVVCLVGHSFILWAECGCFVLKLKAVKVKSETELCSASLYAVLVLLSPLFIMTISPLWWNVCSFSIAVVEMFSSKYIYFTFSSFLREMKEKGVAPFIKWTRFR